MVDEEYNQTFNIFQDMGQYLKMYQNLNRLNISLQQEISIYQKVLSEEEARYGGLEKSYIQLFSILLIDTKPNILLYFFLYSVLNINFKQMDI